MELLNLQTVVKRDTITIDGKQYECVNVDELGPFEHAELTKRHTEAMPLLTSEKKLTAMQSRTLDRILSEVVHMLVPTIKPAVVKALTVGARAQIMHVWAARVNALTAEREATGNRKSRRTGAVSSRGSKRSTAATRKSGSTRRRAS